VYIELKGYTAYADLVLNLVVSIATLNVLTFQAETAF